MYIYVRCGGKAFCRVQGWIKCADGQLIQQPFQERAVLRPYVLYLTETLRIVQGGDNNTASWNVYIHTQL